MLGFFVSLLRDGKGRLISSISFLKLNQLYIIALLCPQYIISLLYWINYYVNQTLLEGALRNAHACFTDVIGITKYYMIFVLYDFSQQ